MSFRKYIVKSQLSKSSGGGLNFGTVTNEKAANQNGFFEEKIWAESFYLFSRVQKSREKVYK